MREVKEVAVWRELKKRLGKSSSSPIQLTPRISVDLDEPCLVVGGKNGAGKTRFLRRIANHLDGSAVMVDLHFLCEQALTILRSRNDFDDMTEEFGPLQLDAERLDDLARVIGREYESVEWFAFEVEPDDSFVAERFKWASEQSLLPYFRVKYRGSEYSSCEMGLGEFSVHFLFWILEQYRDSKDLTILLDEPDAFLPPIGVSRLLARILRICAERSWKVILSTHSEEMIRQAVEEGGFLLLRTDHDGESVAISSKKEPSAAGVLLARPPVEHIAFCEDEVAAALLRGLLEADSPMRAKSVSIIWGNGHGYMTKLRGYLPKPPKPDVNFTFVYDGDQRTAMQPAGAEGWKVMFLPSENDPDWLFKQCSKTPAELADALNISSDRLVAFLDSIEGADPHDWVNRLCDEFGRPLVLRTLSSLWCSQNPDQVSKFFVDWE